MQYINNFIAKKRDKVSITITSSFGLFSLWVHHEGLFYAFPSILLIYISNLSNHTVSTVSVFGHFAQNVPPLVESK